MKFLLIFACIEYSGSGMSLVVAPAASSVECEKRGAVEEQKAEAEGKRFIWICHDIRSFARGG